MSTLKVGAIRGVSASSDAVTVADNGTCTANVTNNLSNRNKVGNGEMLCAQRGTSFSPNASAQIYTLDRFQHIATTGAAFDSTVTQDSSAPAGFSKSYKVTPDATDTPSGGGNACIRTKIEGQDVQDLAYGGSDAKKVTVSFYAKSASQNNSQQYTFQLRHFATDGTQRSINAPFTITSSFQRFTFSFVGDTAVDIIKTNALGMELVWQLASGPDDITSQQTTWVTTNLFTCVTGQSNFLDSTSNEFYLTGVQLEVDHTGSGVATDFEHRSYGQELDLCKRYFQQYGIDSYGNNTKRLSLPFINEHASNTGGYINFRFEKEMRAAPTATIGSSLELGQPQVDRSSYVVSSFNNLHAQGSDYFQFSGGQLGSEGDSNRYIRFGHDANAFAKFSAEL